MILQGVADGITVQDRSGKLVFANAAAARLLGYPSSQALLAASQSDVVQRFVMFDESGQLVPLDGLPGRRALQGVQEASATLRFRVVATGEERWSVVKANPVFDDAGGVRCAINVFIDVTERKRAEDTQRFLVEASQQLASSLDYETTMQRVADLAVPALADWCAVDLLGEGGTIRTLAVAHRDPAKVAWARELQRRYPVDPVAAHGVPNVLRTGQPELYPEISDEMLVASTKDAEQLAILREVGFTSVVVLPLNARGRTLGALSLVWAESGHRYGPADLALAEQLAGAAALAIDNAWLYQEARQSAEAQTALNATLLQLAEARDRALAVAESERSRLQQVLDVLPEGVLIADAVGTFSMSNLAATHLMGVDVTGQAMPVAGSQAYELFGIRRVDGTHFPTEELPLQRAVLRGEVVQGEQLLVRNALDGRDIPILTNSAPLRDSAGGIAGGVTVFQDISAIKDLERQKDLFLGSVSHDLKNPLMAVKGQAQLMRRRIRRAGMLEPARLTEGLDQIEAATDRTTAMVNELLDVTRLQMGRPLELDRQAVDLVALARQVTEESQSTSTRHHLRVEAGVSELVGYWDGVRLGRVLDNLLSNAIKYSPAGSDILVTVGREDSDGAVWAVLEVRDTGLGIPAQDLPHIFERFHRGSNVRDLVAGIGIGLAGAQQIVEQHGGALGVESTEGQGSTFTVRLPLPTQRRDGATEEPRMTR